MGSQLDQLLKYPQTGSVRAWNLEMAREEARRRERPGGVPRAFWEAVRTRSRSHSENLMDSPAREQTESREIKVEGEYVRTALMMDWM